MLFFRNFEHFFFFSNSDRHEVSQVDKKLLTSPPPSEMSDRQQVKIN